MVATKELAEPPIQTLSPEEGRAFFDAQARALLGISGAEFLERWNSGYYDRTADEPENADVIYLAMMGTRGE